MSTAIYHNKLASIYIEYQVDTLIQLKIFEGNTKIVPNHKSPDTFSRCVFQQIDEYLSGNRKSFDLKYKLNGTPFQLAVWQTLMQIPYGQTVGYNIVAQLVGNKNGARAVGQACKANPLMLIVPCHRVIAANGLLTGFAGGLNIKQKLLKIEKENVKK